MIKDGQIRPWVCIDWVIAKQAHEKLFLISSTNINALVLHSRPYGEGREIVQFLTETMGKFAGVRRLSKRGGFQRLQPFTLGHVRVSGRSSLMNVSSFDYVKKYDFAGERLAVGFYVLELIQKLLAEGEPDPGIYQSTIKALEWLSTTDQIEKCLRIFEIELLASLGYEVDFGSEGASGERISESGCYQFAPDQGFYKVKPNSERGISGKDLLPVNAGIENLGEPTLKILKVINRKIIDSLLSGRELTSRKLLIKQNSRSNETR